MDKTLIIERLQNTIDKLQTLKESQYNNSWSYGYVTKCDAVTFKPLVATVAGYYPLWFPDAKLQTRNGGIVPEKGLNIPLTLQEYHGVNQSLIACLFFRRSLGNDTISDDRWTLAETINKWIACKYCIENDLIAYN